MKISHTLSLSETTSLKRDQVLLFLFNSAILLQKMHFIVIFSLQSFSAQKFILLNPLNLHLTLQSVFKKVQFQCLFLTPCYVCCLFDCHLSGNVCLSVHKFV